MAIPKLVKVGGTYYKGDSLPVSAGTGDYQLDFTFTTAGATNALSIIPTKTGDGDTMKVEHLDANGDLKVTLAEGIPNLGGFAAWKLDFPALQKVLANETIRLTYTNVAGVAMTVYMVLERIR